MSAENFVEAVGHYSDRKTLIKRASATALAATMYLVGSRATPAEAGCFQHGCNLCDPCTSSCPSISCAWCWWGTCHQNPGGSSWHRTLCCEGYRAGGSCYTANCGTGWACSYYGGTGGC